jgi:hypothetical protein
MRRILFIIPINRSYVIMPPIGLGYLATVAREQDWEPDILDCLKAAPGYEDFERYIVQNPADIYGISMMTYDVSSVKRHIRIIRKHFPRAILHSGERPNWVSNRFWPR